MPVTADEVDLIESKVLSLPRDARKRLLEALYASLDMDPRIERAWEEEIHRRFADVKAGRAEFEQGEDFDRELADRLR